MNILYIITQSGGGGAQNYTLDLAQAFGGSIAAGAQDTKLFEDARRAGIATFPLKHLKREVSPLSDFLAAWEIRQLIEHLQPDIVHLNSSKAGVLGSFAAMGLKKKVIFTAHGLVLNEPLGWAVKNFYLALEKTASDFRDYIICVSEADKTTALNYKLIAPEKISTIYNGIEAIEFVNKQQAREFLQLPQDKIIIGCLANFYRTKGLDVLIDAVAQLDAGLKSKIVVFLPGSGPELEYCKLKIAEYRLEDIVKLPGNIDNASRYLKAYDIFVLPSRKEGFPFALLEAMQAGLPIVASQVGGVGEALGDSGFLVAPENSRELLEVLSKLIQDLNSHGPQYFSGLGQKTKARAALFTREKMLRETEKVYQKLLE